MASSETQPVKRESEVGEGAIATCDHIESQTGAPRSTAERKLLRQIDLYVLPWLCITYGLSLIDRTNIAAANIAGMAADLKLDGNMYSVALLAFFIPYILTEIPSNAVLRRLGAKSYLTTLIFCWGVVAMSFGFVKTFGQLIALRVLLGVFEGGFNPACIYIISTWYRRHEVQQRLAIWFVSGSAIAGFTGIFSYALTLMDGRGGLAGWRWIFIIPGLITAVLAVLIFIFIADFPERATWLTGEQMALIRQRTLDDRGEAIEAATARGVREGLLSALRDWKVYAMSLLLLLPTAGSYSLAFFTPVILESFGFSVALSQILTTPPYIFAAIVSVGTGIIADRVKMRTPFIIGFSVVVIVGLVLIGWGNNTGAKLVGIFLAVTGNNCAIPAALALLSNNVVGSTKRQFAVPVQTIFGGLGGILGALMFRQEDRPAYRTGLYASCGCMALNIALAAGMALYFSRRNKKADEEGELLEGIPDYRYTI